jgi:SAM-dependent methyltransferase
MPSPVSFDPKHFEKLYALESRSFWFRGRSDLINWAFARYFHNAHDALEIGCGTGYVLDRLHRAFPRLALSGSELFPQGLEYARQRLGNSVSLLQLDAKQLNLREAFDVVGAFDVLEHIDDDVAVVSNVLNALRPGGGFLITVPQHMWLWSKTDVAACHARRYSRVELRDKLLAAGFEVLRTTSFVSMLLPAMLLSRRSKRGGNDKADAELDLPGPLNAIGLATLKIEEMLIRGGVNFPLGGSLLVIARKPCQA